MGGGGGGGWVMVVLDIVKLEVSCCCMRFDLEINKLKVMGKFS